MRARVNLAEPISIKKRIKIVASGERPSFSKPKIRTLKKTNKNRIGKNKTKRMKINEPTGRKNIIYPYFGQQHFLYFLPEPQGQGSFLPTFFLPSLGINFFSIGFSAKRGEG